MPELAFELFAICMLVTINGMFAMSELSVVMARNGAIATSQPLASAAGLRVLQQGGNAIDAAVTAAAVLSVVEPHMNGIGGDLFAIVWDPKTGKLHGYNGSGRSPRSLTLAEFERRGLKDIPPHGPLPVTVPGTVDGWFALHGRFGKRTMAQNLAPAIAYAREGHPVHETIAYYWDRSVPRLSKWPGFREQFTIDGRAPRDGSRPGARDGACESDDRGSSHQPERIGRQQRHVQHHHHQRRGPHRRHPELRRAHRHRRRGRQMEYL